MKRNSFEYSYDIVTNEWVMEFDGHEVMRLDDESVLRVSDELDLQQNITFRMICANIILARMENEENGFFVSAVLSKLFNYGMNWSKGVK